MLTSTQKRQASKATFTLKGGLVAGSIDQLRDKLKKVISEGVTSVVFDMTAVEAIDSSGVGFLAAVYNSLKKIDGSLLVTGLSKDMYQFFISLRLNAHFKIEQRKE